MWCSQIPGAVPEATPCSQSSHRLHFTDVKTEAQRPPEARQLSTTLDCLHHILPATAQGDQVPAWLGGIGKSWTEHLQPYCWTQSLAPTSLSQKPNRLEICNYRPQLTKIWEYDFGTRNTWSLTPHMLPGNISGSRAPRRPPAPMQPWVRALTTIVTHGRLAIPHAVGATLSHC